MDEKGRIQWVGVGDADELHGLPGAPIPEEHPTTAHRWYCIHTHLGGNEKAVPTSGDQVTLLQYRFAAIVVLAATTNPEFSRQHGETRHHCDGGYIIQPQYTPNEESEHPLAHQDWLNCMVSEPMVLGSLEEESRDDYLVWGRGIYEEYAHTHRHTQNQTTAILIGCYRPGAEGLSELEDTLGELKELVETWGTKVITQFTQSRPTPDPKTYLGQGKVRELALWVQQSQATMVVADDELSPGQQRRLEGILRVTVLDRTEVILHIFAQRAQSREGQLQVALAQLKYELPRLTGRGKALSQQTAVGRGSGVTATRGPGETQLEAERRQLRHQIHQLEQSVKAIAKHRRHQRQRRQSQSVPVVALVGYTNAGKSTLMQRLTGADVLVANQLFATLDTTTRQLYIPDLEQNVLLTDTVGFIRKLPTFLVKSFHATLEEVIQADLILHIWDVTHPNRLDHWQAVMDTLEELGITEQPIWTLCNKIDRWDEWENTSFEQEWDAFEATTAMVGVCLPISATTGQGIEALRQEIYEFISTLSETEDSEDEVVIQTE